MDNNSCEPAKNELAWSALEVVRLYETEEIITENRKQ